MYYLKHLPKHSVFLDVYVPVSSGFLSDIDHNLQLYIFMLPFTSKVVLSEKTVEWEVRFFVNSLHYELIKFVLSIEIIFV